METKVWLCSWISKEYTVYLEQKSSNSENHYFQESKKQFQYQIANRHFISDYNQQLNIMHKTSVKQDEIV
jgi:hypothetical protein